MDTEYVRSRFIKHFDGTTGFLYASPGRINRSEERRVGKECRSRWSPYH